MPGATEPRDPASPSTRAGASLAARAASASGTPAARAAATTRSRVEVPPAIEPVPEASRATPPDTVTGSGPSV